MKFYDPKHSISLSAASLLLLSAIVSIVQPVATCQTSRGAVTGIVTDQQEAVVANAMVEIENAQTGITRTAATNEAGVFRFDALEVGEYSVKVTMSGFRTFLQRGLLVQGGETLTNDVKLVIGETRSSIEVAADAVALQTDGVTRGGSLASATLSQLPMSSRDPAQFALTLPGVVTDRYGFGANSFSVNGSRGRSNNFMVDGTENNDVSIAGQLFQITNPDSVAEVSVQTTNFDAEYGRAGGAVVNTITKSGTKDFHGTISYVLDVTNDDALTNTQSLSPAIIARGKPLPGTEQWYGFTLGGPVKKDRTFFFVSFQDQRQNSQNTQSLVTPTAKGWATLDQLFPQGTNPRIDLYRQIAGPVMATSQPYNVVMGNNRPAVEFGTSIFSYGSKYLDRQYMIRIDHELAAMDHLSARYIKDRQDSPQGGASPFFPGFSTSRQYPTQNFVLMETHVFSATMTNELRLPYNRANLAYPVDPANALGKTMPLYTIGGGITPIGVQTTLPQGRTVNNYAIQETVSWVHGMHTLRFGTTLTQQRARQYAPIRERGEIVYATSTGYSNFANFADDFGGSSGGVQRDFGSAAYYPSYTRQAYFVQDHWRAGRDVTLSLGIRYEYFGTPMNTLKKSSYSGIFNLDPVTLTGPYSDFTKVDPDKNNWGPTVGIAWSPGTSGGLAGKLFGNKKAVIRTGYQISYDSFFNNIASNAAVATPNVIATSITSTAGAANPRGLSNWSTMLPVVARAPAPNDGQTLIIKNLVNPYYQKWSFGIQRELPAGTALDVSYVGSKGTRLYANEDFNPTVPASMRITPANANPAAVLTNRLDNLQGARLTRTNGGGSNYHALQVSADRRFAQGLQLKVAYTWSKSIDNTSDVFGVANNNLPQNTTVPSIYGGLAWDRSLSFNDRTHRAAISYLYAFPWRKDQRGALGRIAGGWQLAGITTFETGIPMNIMNGSDADGIGGSYDRPLFNPNGRPGVRALATSSGYVNPEAGNAPIDPASAMYIGLPSFTGSSPAATGNLGRNTARLPGINNFNVNLAKNIRMLERVTMEFRAELYNLWNHPQYGIASVSPFSPGSGTIAANVQTSAAGRFLQPQYMDGGGRVVRYQLRLAF